MELRQLEYFVELCRVRNFTRASENLNVAQPSVTRAIQRLEDELGVRLVERDRKPVGLTKAGETLYAGAQETLERLDALVREITAGARTRRKVVNIGISPFTGVLLDRMLTSAGFARQGVFFNIIRRSSVEIVSLLLSRELDLGWVIGEDLPEELEFLPLETQEALLLHPDHPLCRRETISISDLRDEPLSLQTNNRNSILSRLVVRRCREAGFEPVQDIGAPQFHPDLHMAVEWVRNGLGPSFIPEHAAVDVMDLAVTSICPPLTFQTGLALRRGGGDPEIRRLIGRIQEQYPRFVTESVRLHKNVR